MDDEIRHRMLSRPAFRMLRWTMPWVALGLLLLALGGLASEFRKSSAGAGESATSTVDATASLTPTKTTDTPKATPETPAPDQSVQTPAQQPTTPAKATVAIALVEGILLRKSPSASGEVMDRLKNGTEMAVLETTDQWLRVKDPLGRVGWIRNNENLISLKQK